MNRAWIEGYVHYVPSYDGKECPIYTYTWKGSKYATAEIAKKAFKECSLPWPVYVLDEIDFGRGLLIIRKDVGWHLHWIFVSLWYKSFRSFRYFRFKLRVIKTFELWGFGYQTEGEKLSWKSILRKNKNWMFR